MSPNPVGGLQHFQSVQGSAASSSVSPGHAGEGFFRTSPDEKSATLLARFWSALPPHSSPGTPALCDVPWCSRRRRRRSRMTRRRLKRLLRWSSMWSATGGGGGNSGTRRRSGSVGGALRLIALSSATPILRPPWDFGIPPCDHAGQVPAVLVPVVEVPAILQLLFQQSMSYVFCASVQFLDRVLDIPVGYLVGGAQCTLCTGPWSSTGPVSWYGVERSLLCNNRCRGRLCSRMLGSTMDTLSAFYLVRYGRVSHIFYVKAVLRTLRPALHLRTGEVCTVDASIAEQLHQEICTVFSCEPLVFGRLFQLAADSTS